MNIYALRDRLIDYYMRAFSAPDDKDVLASVASTINEGDPNSAIAKAPHHFEIWRLGKVTEEGDLRPGKELICDCSSLIRERIRPGPNQPSGAYPAEQTYRSSSEPLTRPGSRHAALNGAVPHPARPEDRPGAETPTAAPRGHYNPDLDG